MLTLGKGHTNKRLAFQQSIWSALPAQNLCEISPPLQRDKSQRPDFNKHLLRQTPIHTASECFSCFQPRDLSLGEEEFLKKYSQRMKDLWLRSTVQMVVVCLVTRWQKDRTICYHSWILKGIRPSKLKRIKIAVSLDDALQTGREPVEHSKSSCHSFLFFSRALNCTIKSLHDWKKKCMGRHRGQI